MDREVEFFRLLDDYTWDTVTESVPKNKTDEEFAQELLFKSKNRKVVLIGVYNDNPNEGNE